MSLQQLRFMKLGITLCESKIMKHNFSWATSNHRHVFLLHRLPGGLKVISLIGFNTNIAKGHSSRSVFSVNADFAGASAMGILDMGSWSIGKSLNR